MANKHKPKKPHKTNKSFNKMITRINNNNEVLNRLKNTING